MQNHLTTNAFDCGDGVPELVLDTNVAITEEVPALELAARQPIEIGAPLAVMILTILGQVVILLAVLAGGNALVGATAGLALLVCAVILLGAKTLREALFGQ